MNVVTERGHSIVLEQNICAIGIECDVTGIAAAHHGIVCDQSVVSAGPGKSAALDQVVCVIGYTNIVEESEVRIRVSRPGRSFNPAFHEPASIEIVAQTTVALIVVDVKINQRTRWTPEGVQAVVVVAICGGIPIGEIVDVVVINLFAQIHSSQSIAGENDGVVAVPDVVVINLMVGVVVSVIVPDGPPYIMNAVVVHQDILAAELYGVDLRLVDFAGRSRMDIEVHDREVAKLAIIAGQRIDSGTGLLILQGCSVCCVLDRPTAAAIDRDPTHAGGTDGTSIAPVGSG